VKKLEAAPTSTQNGMRDVPVTPLVIESVRLKQGWATVMTCVPVLLEAERKNASTAAALVSASSTRLTDGVWAQTAVYEGLGCVGVEAFCNC
jgi:hypothetical protein